MTYESFANPGGRTSRGQFAIGLIIVALVAAFYYFRVKGTTGPGLAVVVPGTAAGACVIDGAASATPIVGMMMETGVDGKVKAVKLKLGA